MCHTATLCTSNIPCLLISRTCLQATIAAALLVSEGPTVTRRRVSEIWNRNCAVLFTSWPISLIGCRNVHFWDPVYWHTTFVGTSDWWSDRRNTVVACYQCSHPDCGYVHLRQAEKCCFERSVSMQPHGP